MSAPEIILSLAGEQLLSPPALEDADRLELRLDTLPSPTLDKAAAVVEHFGDAVPLLATLRSAAEMGAWRGDEAERLRWYRHLAPMVNLVDVELEADIAAAVAEAAGGHRTLLSWHGAFADCDMEAAYRRCLKLDCDWLKLAVEVDTLEQLGALLGWQRNHPQPTSISHVMGPSGVCAQRPSSPMVITLGMGRLGRLSRLLCLLQGSAAGYAFADGAEALAPGQTSLSELRGMLRRHPRLFDGSPRQEADLRRCLDEFLGDDDPPAEEVLALL